MTFKEIAEQASKKCLRKVKRFVCKPNKYPSLENDFLEIVIMEITPSRKYIKYKYTGGMNNNALYMESVEGFDRKYTILEELPVLTK